MKAVLLNGITSAEEVALSEVGIPEVRPGWVLVKVKAFGMNHSEKILRLQEIESAYIQKPIIPGIECVGEIVHASDRQGYPVNSWSYLCIGIRCNADGKGNRK